MNFEESLADKLTRQSEHQRLLIASKDEKIEKLQEKLKQLQKVNAELQEHNEKLKQQNQDARTHITQESENLNMVLKGIHQLVVIVLKLTNGKPQQTADAAPGASQASQTAQAPSAAQAAQASEAAQDPPTPKSTRTLPPLRRQ